MFTIWERTYGGGVIPFIVGTVVLELLQLSGFEIRGVCSLLAIEDLQEG